MIEVVDFRKVYRGTVAVDGLSFSVGRGEVLGFVGPNGAGKTTTLRALAGILPPTSGRLAVAGHDVVRDPVAARRQVAYVPDDPQLFDALTVWEHLEFIASAYRVDAYEAKARQLLEMFELLPKRDALARDLSRGMRQKVAIACAYLQQSPVILFDEPLTGLDPQGIRTIKHSIHRHAAEGRAVIVSSHLLSLIEDLCTHLLVLHRGKAVHFGTMAEARALLGGKAKDATLEEFFFRMTEGRPPADGL
ncbi:MAG: ABC transporter ATP-binding protein [Thermoguttaceae bacterium]